VNAQVAGLSPEGLLGAEFAYQVNSHQSITGESTLYPDLNDTNPASDVVAGFVLHGTVGPTLFSPGTQIDGSPF